MPIHITRSLNSESDSCPEIDPLEEIRIASLETLNESNLEEDA